MIIEPYISDEFHYDTLAAAALMKKFTAKNICQKYRELEPLEFPRLPHPRVKEIA